MKLKLLSLFFFFLNAIVWSQIVEIPDENFKFLCVNLNAVDFDGDGIPDSKVDTNNDGEIQVSEAEAVEYFYPGAYNIVSLQGIEAFVNLKELNCSWNSLTSLDLTQNTQLEVLSCYFNYIPELDVSQMPNLRILACDFNELTALDVSQNPNLERLDCPSNLITEIDVTQNPNLVDFEIDDNNITQLDVTQNPLLEVFSADSNQLSSMDFSQNPVLRVVDLHNNVITDLDFSTNTELDKLWCYENALVSLNLNNGNNMDISIFSALDNPDLNCVQVDDPIFASSQGNWSIDDSATYSLNCVLGVSSFETLELQLSPNPVSEALYFSTDASFVTESLTIHDVLGRTVYQSQVHTDRVDVSKFPSGIFFLTVVFEGNRVTKQFIKQ